jgi:hypothetical protein
VARHDALEYIIIALVGRSGRLGMIDAEKIAKLGQEQRIVCALLSAFLSLPAFDERLDGV